MKATHSAEVGGVGSMPEGRIGRRIFASPVLTECAGSTALWLWMSVVVGAILRLYALEFQSLWYDEGLQYHVATTYASGDLFHQRSSFHPPLSFLINRWFLLIEPSDFWLRFPSAMFGIASLPLFFILAKKLTSTRTALVGVLILASSAMHVWYSQDGRMYSQLMFMSLLSSLFLMQAVKRGNLRWWIGYAVTNAAGLYTHVFMALALLVHLSWILSYERRYVPVFMWSVIAGGVAFVPWVLLLPWVGAFLQKVTEATVSGGATVVAADTGGRASFSWMALPYSFFVYSAGFSLGPSVAELHDNKSLEVVWQSLPAISLTAFVYGVAFVSGIVSMFKNAGAKARAFVILGLAVPFVITIVYSVYVTFNVRYTIIAFPYFCLIIAIGLVALIGRNKCVGVGALLGIVTISSFSLYNYFTNSRYAKEDVKAAVAFWRSASAEELLLSHRAMYTTRRYLEPSEQKRLYQLPRAEEQTLIKTLLSREGPSSVFVLLARDWKQMREQSIRKAFTVMDEQAFPGVKLLRISNNRTFPHTQ